MRTTLNVDPCLIDEVKKITGESDRGKAVNRALEEYVRRQKIERLIEMAGTIEFDDDWQERHERELELEEEHRARKLAK